MTANGIKEWTVGNGDFHHNDDTDYEKKFRRAKKDNQSFETKIKVFFAISGMGILVLLLELMTRF